MSKIEIELRDLTSGGGVKGSLDIKDSDDFPLSLNYLIADIKNLSVRSGSYSKTFNIPATKHNNDLLKHIWNPNTYVDGVSTYSGNSHKMLQRKPCVVKVDSVPVLRGEIKVKNVITKPKGKEYVMQLIGDNSDWVKQIETLYLNELTLFDSVTSQTDHTYNKATIEASWSGSYSGLDGASSYTYFYPLINYGTWNDVNGVVVEDMRPAVYIRAILDAAFRSVGYTLNSTFLDSTDFKKLVFPFVGEDWKLSDTYINARKYRAGLTTTQVINNTSLSTTNSGTTTQKNTINIDDDSTTPNFDTGSLYNNSAYKFVANGSYMTRFKGQIKIINNHSINGDFKILIKKVSGLTTTYYDATTLITINANDTQTIQYESGYIELNNSDEISLVVESTYLPSSLAGLYYYHTHKFQIIGVDVGGYNTHIYNEIDNEILTGQSIVLKDVLPNDVTALDILKGITHMFNLYYRTDTANQIIYVEPRDTFFEATTSANDWTTKLNKNNYQLAFIDDYKKNLTFGYKRDGSDGHVKARDEEYEHQLGEYKYTLNDRFMMGKQKFENPIFAPTYHILDRNIIYSTTPTNEAKHKAPLIARMWRNWNGDDAGQPKHFEYEPRILYKSYGTQADDDGNNRAWKWEGTSQTNIPTALMSGYGDVTQTNLSYNGSDGLFQTHYGAYINVIEKGVILTALFDLDTQDISEVNLKKPVFIGKPSDLHGYYVINKIIDYSPSKSALTKVELVKIENQGTATYDSGQTEPTRGNFDFGEIGGTRGYDHKNLPFHTGVGGKFDDDDPIQGVDVGGTTAVMDNGTNFAKKGSNNVVFGKGNIAKGKNQTIVGNYAAVDTESVFQVGMGNNENDRRTPLKIDSDGAMIQYGGQIQAVIGDVVVDVMVEDADNERLLKLFKSE
jgi:hypothetical protein